MLAGYEWLSAQGCDVIHDHTLAGPLYGPATTPTPVVTTNHGPFTSPELASIYRAVQDQAAIVAISHDQARDAGQQLIDVAAVIHHGLDTSAIPVGHGDGGYLLFLGRMAPEKGAHQAIAAARATGQRLIIAAKMREPAEFAYFRNEVAPHLGDGVEFVGEVAGDDKWALLGGATALVNPITWSEPFGLVMIEALAAGTPVVALPKGRRARARRPRHHRVPRRGRGRARRRGRRCRRARPGRLPQGGQLEVLEGRDGRFARRSLSSTDRTRRPERPPAPRRSGAPMKREPVIVVGGGAAGHAFIDHYRQAGGEVDLVLVTREDRLPYLRPLLTKDYLRGEAGVDQLPLDDPGWYGDRAVDLRLACDVEALDVAAGPSRHDLDQRRALAPSAGLRRCVGNARGGVAPGPGLPRAPALAAATRTARVSEQARGGRTAPR